MRVDLSLTCFRAPIRVKDRDSWKGSKIGKTGRLY
jgi:hypothetical protein